MSARTTKNTIHDEDQKDQEERINTLDKRRSMNETMMVRIEQIVRLNNLAVTCIPKNTNAYDGSVSQATYYFRKALDMTNREVTTLSLTTKIVVLECVHQMSQLVLETKERHYQQQREHQQKEGGREECENPKQRTFVVGEECYDEGMNVFSKFMEMDFTNLETTWQDSTTTIMNRITITILFNLGMLLLLYLKDEKGSLTVLKHALKIASQQQKQETKRKKSCPSARCDCHDENTCGIRSSSNNDNHNHPNGKQYSNTNILSSNAQNNGIKSEKETQTQVIRTKNSSHEKSDDCDDECNGCVSTIRILFAIGYIYYKNGCYKKALKMYKKAFQTLKKVETKENFRWATSGYCNKTKEQPRHLLDLAATFNCLGVVYYHLRKSGSTAHNDTAMNHSRELFMQSILSYDKLLGSNLMESIQLTKDKTSSTTTALVDINIASNNHNCNYSQIATTLNNTGRFYYHKGEYHHAINVYNISLHIRRQLCGEKPTLDLAATLYNVGQTYHKMHNLTEAIGYYEDFLGIMKPYYYSRKNPTNHPNLTKSIILGLSCLAEVYRLQTKYDRSVSLYKEALDICNRFDDETTTIDNHHHHHPKQRDYDEQVACILNKLGNIFFEKDEIDNALKSYKKGLQVERDILLTLEKNKYRNGNHKNTKMTKSTTTINNFIITLTNIAQIYKLRNEYEKAIQYYMDAIVMQKRRSTNFGNTRNNSKSNCSSTSNDNNSNNANADVNIITNLVSVAFIYFQTEQYAKSLRIYLKVLHMQQRHYYDKRYKHRSQYETEDIHSVMNIASTFNSIGLLYFEMNAQGIALEYFFKCYKIRMKILGYYHHDVAIVLHNIGAAYLELKDDDMALKYSKDALLIDEHINNANNVKIYQDSISTLQQIGHIYRKRGELNEAINFFHKAINLLKRGRDDEILATTTESAITITADRIDEIEKEKKEYSSNKAELATLQKQKQQPPLALLDHSEMAKTLNNLGNVYLQRGQTKEMVRAFADATRHLRLASITRSKGKTKNEEQHQEKRAAEEYSNELKICGLKFYALSKLHPECAPTA